MTDATPHSAHHKRFQKLANQTANEQEHESAFQRLADWTSAAMGRPTNIMVWLVVVVAWTAIFAARIVPANADAGRTAGLAKLTMLPNDEMNRLFEATVEATEEAIVNAMVGAETMTGFEGRTVIGLPHDRLQEVLKKYNRLGQ